MADEKKLAAPALAPKQPKYAFTDYAPGVQTEIKNLMNVERLLRRVKGLDGDEAFVYVETRKWVAEKAALLKIAEEARLDAVAVVEAKKTKTPAKKAATA